MRTLFPYLRGAVLRDIMIDSAQHPLHYRAVSERRLDAPCYPLAPYLQAFFESKLGHSLRGVRIHQGTRADFLNRRFGSIAFAHKEHLYFRRGAFAPETPWGLWLLAHELAHVIQQRGTNARTARSPAALEWEANAAACAVMMGRPAHVEPRAGCPSIQPAVPLLLLLAVAVGVIAWPKDMGPEPKPDGSPPLPVKSLHETGWGFVPVVGSLDQMINGKNLLSQMMGGVFFVLDVSLVGGVAVKGVMFTMTAARKAALQSAAKAAPGAVERLSYEALMKQGAKALSKEEAARMLKDIGGKGATTVVVGAQSGKQGAFHSIIYVVKDGKIYRLHGGLMSRASGGQAMTVEKALAQSWNKGFNSYTVYNAKDLAAKGITDEALSALVNTWGRRAPGMLPAIENVCRARGCAYSQWLLMEQLGLPSATGANRFLPLLMETSRMSGNLGSHYIVNPTGAYAGTALQTFLVGGLAGSVRFAYPAATTDVIPRAVMSLATQQPTTSDAAMAYLPTGVAEQLNGLTQQENSVLMLPTDDLSFDPDAVAFPNNGQIVVDYPNDPVIEQSTSVNACFRLPELGGAKRSAMSPGR
jgi:hypothetical protein